MYKYTDGIDPSYPDCGFLQRSCHHHAQVCKAERQFTAFLIYLIINYLHMSPYKICAICENWPVRDFLVSFETSCAIIMLVEHATKRFAGGSSHSAQVYRVSESLTRVNNTPPTQPSFYVANHRDNDVRRWPGIETAPGVSL